MLLVALMELGLEVSAVEVVMVALDAVVLGLEWLFVAMGLETISVLALDVGRVSLAVVLDGMVVWVVMLVAAEATVVGALTAAVMLVAVVGTWEGVETVAVATPLTTTGISLASRSSHWVHQKVFWQQVFWVGWLRGGLFGKKK